MDLGAAVLAAKESGLLIAGGGHAMAAGLTLPAGGLEAFREFINDRLAADVEKSRGDRALLLDALLAVLCIEAEAQNQGEIREQDRGIDDAHAGGSLSDPCACDTL